MNKLRLSLRGDESLLIKSTFRAIYAKNASPEYKLKKNFVLYSNIRCETVLKFSSLFMNISTVKKKQSGQ